MPKEIELKIDGINEKGYGVAEQDGRKYFVIDALPGEIVRAEIIKKKKGARYCRNLELIEASKYRVALSDPAQIEVAPWAITDIKYENELKQSLLNDWLGSFGTFYTEPIVSSEREGNYRNKMEFEFFLDGNEEISLAYHKRDSRFGKVSIKSSILAADAINTVAADLIKSLNSDEVKNFIKASGIELRWFFKGAAFRFSQYENKVLMLLYIKNEVQESEKLMKLILNRIGSRDLIKGCILMYSDRRSPAFVETQRLAEVGESDLTEKASDKLLTYPYNSFFQINVPMLELAVQKIRRQLDQFRTDSPLRILDLYAGVGTLGILAASEDDSLTAVESTLNSKAYAEENARIAKIKNFTFHEIAVENLKSELDISQFDVVILDPPRAGLHPSIIEAVSIARPERLIYLSCNPKTQASDLSQLLPTYTITFSQGFNFYPKTPHVENLIFLNRSDML